MNNNRLPVTHEIEPDFNAPRELWTRDANGNAWPPCGCTECRERRGWTEKAQAFIRAANDLAWAYGAEVRAVAFGALRDAAADMPELAAALRWGTYVTGTDVRLFVVAGGRGLEVFPEAIWDRRALARFAVANERIVDDGRHADMEADTAALDWYKSVDFGHPAGYQGRRQTQPHLQAFARTARRLGILSFVRENDGYTISGLRQWLDAPDATHIRVLSADGWQDLTGAPEYSLVQWWQDGFYASRQPMGDNWTVEVFFPETDDLAFVQYATEAEAVQGVLEMVADYL